ncbi:MAG TPA: POTRA domain-containing protein, partial [Anaeromyxobacteraceae bacterium]|nr:POTRA domain-containing protein [Anaeromyxobacteraceae bacterium]
MPTLALALLLAAGLSSERGTNETAEREPLAVERRYVVERIRLEGLQQTRPSEVLRHLTVTEGQLLDDQAVLVSRLRLLQLGWFSRVDTRVEKGSERGLVVLVFDFTERNTLIISDLV